MTGRRSQRSLALGLIAAVASGAAISVLSVLAAGCTSGTTPNCSDAAEMCDPYEAGSDSGMPTESGLAESSAQGG